MEIPAMGGRQATITNTRHKAKIADQSSSVEGSKHVVPKEPKQATGITVSSLIEVYRAERMPQRFSTRYSYDQWLTNHILPHWGEGSRCGSQLRQVVENMAERVGFEPSKEPQTKD